MGTYTTNYNLFMPTVGEQGWGDLVNGNFTTIDVTMKGLDTRLTTCESTDVAYNTRLETLEAGEFETINCTGTITADNFVGGTISGQFTAPTLSYSGYTTYKTFNANQASLTIPIYSHYTPISGVVSAMVSNTSLDGRLIIIGVNGVTTHDLTTTQTEYTVTKAYSVSITIFGTYHYTLNMGNPVFIINQT